jgi:excisionase family DNA binding protein
MSELPPVLTAEQLAERWNVCVGEIWRLCRQNKLGHFRVGRYIRIPRDVVLLRERGTLADQEETSIERRSST